MTLKRRTTIMGDRSEIGSVHGSIKIDEIVLAVPVKVMFPRGMNVSYNSYRIHFALFDRSIMFVSFRVPFLETL